jgi:hypothetical protein
VRRNVEIPRAAETPSTEQKPFDLGSHPIVTVILHGFRFSLFKSFSQSTGLKFRWLNELGAFPESLTGQL